MRSRIRSLLLLFLLGTILLEALALIRMPLARTVHRAYPQVGLDKDGRVLYYDFHIERGPGGELHPVTVLDDCRNAPETLRLGLAESLARQSFGSPGLWPGSSVDFDRPRFLRELQLREVPEEPSSPLELLTRNALNAMERHRRGIDYEAQLVSGERVRPTLPLEWHVEENRLVCRETDSGRVVAGLGPDGYARGEGANEGERFGRLAVGPRVVTGAGRVATGISRLFLLDREARRVHVVSIAKEEEGSVPADSREPIAIAIETSPLHPFQAGETGHEARPCASVVGRHVLVFLSDGSVIADFEMEPNETATWFSNALVVQSEGFPATYVTPGTHERKARATVGMQTALRPCPLDGQRRRLRLFRPGEPDIVRDVVLTPTRASEVLLAHLNGALALLRPAPLAVASALSPSPGEQPGGPWWWRDPWLAGGRYPGWLIASLALAAFCAWRARRAARERCATLREVRFWTAAVFLLGPVGLLWMRFVLPRVPVESVSGARRAVDLDASPSTGAPWPEPKPLGIEVFS